MCVCGIFFLILFVILPIWNNFLVNHLEVDALRIAPKVVGTRTSRTWPPDTRLKAQSWKQQIG